MATERECDEAIHSRCLYRQTVFRKSGSCLRHGQLASSYVILSFCEPKSREVRFNALSGVLAVRKKGNLYEMDFTTYPLTEIPVTDEMEQEFRIRPVKAVLGLDLI